MAVIAYARQSSGDDDKSESIDVQLAAIRDFVEHKGDHVDREYSDLNVSGKTYPVTGQSVAEMDSIFNRWYKSQSKKKKYRDGLARLFLEARPGDKLFIYDATRLCRPITGSFLGSYLQQQLQEHQISLYSLKEGTIDLSNTSTAIVTAITQINNDAQIALSREKSKASVRAMRMRGEVACGVAPTGWRYAGLHKFVQIPEEQEEIRLMFSEFLKGTPRAEIVRTINSMRARRGVTRKLTQSGLDRLYKKPVFCGLMKSPEGNLIDIAPGQYELPWPVAKSDWYKVQTMLSGPGMGPAVRYQYALTGFIRCGFCGKNLVQNQSHQWEGKGVYNDDPAKKSHRLMCKTSTLVSGYTPCSQSHVVYSSHQVPEVGAQEDDEWRNTPINALEEHFQRATLSDPNEPVSFAADGLYEALMPLLAPAMVKHIEDLSSCSKIQERILELRFSIEQNALRRKEIANLLSDDLILPAEARSALESLRTKEISMNEELARLESEAGKNAGDAIHEARYRLIQIQHGVLPPLPYREILRSTIDVVESYASMVRVYFKDKTFLDIPKVFIRNKIAMPQHTLTAIPQKDGGYRYEVRYYLPTFFGKAKDTTEECVYHCGMMDVITVGKTRAPGESNAGRGGQSVMDRIKAIKEEKRVLDEKF